MRTWCTVPSVSQSSTTRDVPVVAIALEQLGPGGSGTSCTASESKSVIVGDVVTEPAW